MHLIYDSFWGRPGLMHNRILLFAGTTEGRLIAEHLAGKAAWLDICVATTYGGTLLPSADNIRILENRLDAEQMQELLRQEGYDLVLDATHPFAQEVSENIHKACREESIRCIRVLRKNETAASGCEEAADTAIEIRYTDTTVQAVKLLQNTDGPVFLTTGSKTLPLFMQLPEAPQRVFARILPSPEMLQHALDLGLAGSHITCAQGPFSTETNLAAIRRIRSRWAQEQPGQADAPLILVTKESGQPGGFSEKLEAAARAGASVIVIRRPQETAGEQDFLTLEQTIALLNSLCGDGSETKTESSDSDSDTPHDIFLIGCGMSASQLTLEAEEAIRSCDLLIGASRLLEMTVHYHKPAFCSYDYAKITEYLLAHPEIRSAAVLFSGDIGLYSGAAKLRECLSPHKDNFHITPLPGISSPVHFLDLLGKSYEDIPVMSLHGQSAPVIARLRTQGRILVLLGKEEDVPDLCQALLTQDMTDVQLTVGSFLHSPQESVASGNPVELADRRFPPLSVVLLEYPDAAQEPVVHGLPDDAFTRGQVPMTKSEVRSIILSKLQLTRKAVFFDIGSGTGSIAVEAARMIPEGHVFAIEQNAPAIDLIRQNAVKLHADHLQVIPGTAPEVLKELPSPTHAFIGGSKGRIPEILETLLKKNPQVRIVASAITAETLLALQSANQTLALPEPEIIQVQVNRAKKAGSSYLMQALNPVYIVTFAPSSKQNKENES